MQKTAVVLLTLTWTVGIAAAPPQSLASTDDATVSELRALVSDLQKQVDALSAASNESWLTQQRAAEIRGLVQDVLADADTRASLLQGGVTAGYDKGFFLASADGNYRLKIGGRLQTRFVYNNQDAPGEDTHRWGFENRRTRVDLSGNFLNPDWTYQIQWDFARGGETVDVGGVPTTVNRGGASLLDAVIGYKFDNGLMIRAGQFKAPFNREELVGSGRQLAVERSLVNNVFNIGRGQGVELSYPFGDNFRIMGMYSDGARTNNTAWQEYDTEWAFTGRAELALIGSAKQFADFSSWKGEELGLLIGAAAHYQKAEFGTTAGPEVEDFRWTVDGSLKVPGGLSVFGAIVGRTLDADGAASIDQLGFVVQGGFFIVPDEWELFARYEWGDADTTGVEDLSVITAGVNRYWAKHNLKWSSDIGLGLNEVQSPWATSSAGWRTDPAGEDGQIVIRSQLQLAF